MIKSCFFPADIKVNVFEINEGKFLDRSDYYIEAFLLEHRVPCMGFRIIEKDRRRIKLDFVKELGIPECPELGRLQRGQNIKWNNNVVKAEDATTLIKGKIVGYISDTQNCSNCMSIARDADILISESTFSSEQQEKAEEYKHMTSAQAALVASNSNATKLILTHFSGRYKEVSLLLDEARTIFPNTIAAYDFLKIKV